MAKEQIYINTVASGITEICKDHCFKEMESLPHNSLLKNPGCKNYWIMASLGE